MGSSLSTGLSMFRWKKQGTNRWEETPQLPQLFPVSSFGIWRVTTKKYVEERRQGGRKTLSSFQCSSAKVVPEEEAPAPADCLTCGSCCYLFLGILVQCQAHRRCSIHVVTLEPAWKFHGILVRLCKEHKLCQFNASKSRSCVRIKGFFFPQTHCETYGRTLWEKKNK